MVGRPTIHMALPLHLHTTTAEDVVSTAIRIASRIVLQHTCYGPYRGSIAATVEVTCENHCISRLLVGVDPCKVAAAQVRTAAVERAMGVRKENGLAADLKLESHPVHETVSVLVVGNPHLARPANFEELLIAPRNRAITRCRIVAEAGGHARPAKDLSDVVAFLEANEINWGILLNGVIQHTEAMAVLELRTVAVLVRHTPPVEVV